MNNKEKLDNFLAPISFFFSSYESMAYAGGITCKNYKVERELTEHTIEQTQNYYKMTIEQATEFKSRMKNCHELLNEFPYYLQEFVSSPSFEEDWKKMSQEEKDFIIFLHEESYPILRQVKQPLEIIQLDLDAIIEKAKISWSKDIKEIFNLPEEFNEVAQNGFQALKQKKVLINLGYDTNSLEYGDKDRYTTQLVNILLPKKTDNLIEIIDKLKIELPWYIKNELNFIEEGEKKFKERTSSRKNKM